ncbi:MAG: hypothetical protein ABL898_12475 [Hyphomicrobiaceae bacterium]|nr:hypothetical protein [Hyphomicrobiaceae bacterium]
MISRLAKTVVALAALVVGGCTHEGFGSLEGHFTTFSVPEPKDNVVYVCHAYGCRERTKFRFTDADFKDLTAVMAKWRTKADTAEDERRAIAYAIGWIETRVGNAIGTKDDRAGMDFAGSGDATQQDCVDEATNTTSYLRVLVSQGLIRQHTVAVPFAKENYLRGVSGWTHWTAVLQETASAQKWAVDSWIYANGENPAIVKTEDWYIASLEELPKSKH